MSISLGRSSLRPHRLTTRLAPLLSIGILTLAAHAQALPTTRLDRQLNRVDFGISGVGLFNSNTNGTNYLNQPLTDSPGNTLGALVTLRYTAKPYVGFEFNYGYARFNQNYNSLGGVQANASEYTLGYVAHTPKVFGIDTFASIGAGTIAYKPTPGGGQGLNEQARAVYYYEVGAEDLVTTHIGLRAFFRQTNSLAPDFGQNYLTILKRTTSTQPGVGVYIHF
jgi:hypothetical protein